MGESQIQKFYKSRNIFITGGTGFMGKILIEKLLRSTEVATLYVLVREKKGKNAHTRIDELFDDVIFDRLKRECPKFKHRVESIPGDCAITGLGLSITDRQKLLSSVHVIFHVAATVKFDENLKLAYNINVSGTKAVLDIARQMKNLNSLMHVSTAYSNCHVTEIEEKFYDYPVSYEQVGVALEKISEAEAELITPSIIGQWPNSYTFTKALAESLIRNTGNGLPVGIFRPSVVISTYREPIEGWIDNLYGPTGFCAGTLTGALRVLKCGRDVTADVVPVDTCIAGLIASAWDVATKDCERTSDNMSIYNYVSSTENLLTWNDYIEVNLMHARKNPAINSLWSLWTCFTSSSMLCWFLRIVCHILPALVIDTIAVLFGNKPRMLRMYKKIHKFCDALTYFSMRKWTFSNKNTMNLWEKLNKSDQRIFPLSIMTVHWLQYFRTYIKGIRMHLLKDPEHTLEAARRRYKRFQLVNSAVKVVLIFVACMTISSLLSKMYGFNV